MIKLITGNKGSGKTKKLIDLTQEAVTNSKGNVVVIEKGSKLTYDISHEARLIDSDSSNILGPDTLYGFICGICEGNYDVTDILVDSTLKICENDLDALIELIKKIDSISKKTNTNFVFSVSTDSESVKNSLSDICEII